MSDITGTEVSTVKIDRRATITYKVGGLTATHVITHLGALASRRAFRLQSSYRNASGVTSRQDETFTGPSAPGVGPVVLIMEGDVSMIVSDPGAHGDNFDSAWMRHYVTRGSDHTYSVTP